MTQSNDVVIVAAGRTAIGKFSGSLGKIAASELGALVIRKLLAQSGIKPTGSHDREFFIGRNPA